MSLRSTGFIPAALISTAIALCPASVSGELLPSRPLVEQPLIDLRAPVTPTVATTSRPVDAFRAMRWSFVAVQVLDTHSTLLATRGGAREANPLMRPFTSSAPLFIALKGASTWMMLRSADRIAKRNPKAAFWVLTAANAALAVVAARNYKVAGEAGR